MILSLLLSLLAVSSVEKALEHGKAPQRAGDTEAAIAAYRECLARDPASVECHWEIGWAYWIENRWEDVVRHWSAVETLDPDHPEVGRYLPRARGYLGLVRRIRVSAASAPDTLPPPPDTLRTLRIRAVGDIMMYTDYPDPETYRPPDDGATLLAAVRPWLGDADLTFGNLEGPLCDGGTTDKCEEGENCYAFRTPTRYGRYLVEAGFDLLSTANNHAADFGEFCLRETERTLEELGIAWSGRPGSVASVEVEGLEVAMIGFHTGGHTNDLNDPFTAQELVRLARRSHDLVIVSFHGGAEGERALHVPDGMEMFYGERRGDLRRFARLVIDAGADLVLGHGPHVLRGMEVIEGHLVAYSLGNFATYARFNMDGPRSTSLVLEVELDREGRLVRGRILPVVLRGEGIPEPDPEGTAIDLVRSLSNEDFARTAPVIARDGTFTARYRLDARAED